MRRAVHTFKSLKQLSVRLVIAESESHSLAFELTDPQPAPSMPHTRSQGARSLAGPLDSSTQRSSKAAREPCEPTAKEIAAAGAARARLYGAQDTSQVCLPTSTADLACPPAGPPSPLILPTLSARRLSHPTPPAHASHFASAWFGTAKNACLTGGPFGGEAAKRAGACER